jgi:hypothetical protein
MLAVCAGIAGLSALLALAFLPRRARTGARPSGGSPVDSLPADGRPAGGLDVAVAAGSGAPLAPPQPDGQDQGHEHGPR